MAADVACHSLAGRYCVRVCFALGTKCAMHSPKAPEGVWCNPGVSLFSCSQRGWMLASHVTSAWQGTKTSRPGATSGIDQAGYHNKMSALEP